jgi:hypothetical protein
MMLNFRMLKTFPPSISMHALSGTSSPASTLTLKLQIGNKTAIALVDSGSDASFINAKFAVKAKCKIQSVSEVKVAAASGAEMLSETACLKCPYSIQGHQFSSDFRLLEVQGYYVVLGADWIYEHSPVGLVLKRREFSITKNGNSLVTFTYDIAHNSSQVIGAKKFCQLISKKEVGAVIVLNVITAEQQAVSGHTHPEIEALLS